MSTNKTYVFVLGREVKLCFAELKAVLNRIAPSYDIINVTKNLVFINIDNIDISSVADLVNILGGTVKIFEIAASRTSDPEKDIYNALIANTEHLERVEFAISSYDSRVLPNRVNIIGLNIKKELKKSKSTRFVALSQGTEISTVVSLKQGLVKKGMEIGIFESYIGKLIGVSNSEEWSKRDYDKPRGDKRSGMLPPKLARMMINLALGQISLESRIKGLKSNISDTPSVSLNSKHSNPNTLVLDSFCGSGNVVLEAMMLSCDVFGSDISEKAVEDTRANVEWLKSKVNSLKSTVEVVQADATSANFTSLIEICELKIKNYDGLAIVSEPYLGEPKKFKQTMNAARGEYRKVKELYLGFFKNIQRLRTQDSGLETVVCLVFPLVETLDKGLYSLYSDCVDEIKKMGYTQIQSPLIYGRDYQVVKREIALLVCR